jgi:hypothetical protein
MPGFISGVGRGVEAAKSVGVAVAGNQTMVPVGAAVFEGRGVAVGRVAAKGRQAARSRNPQKRNEMRKSLIR